MAATPQMIADLALAATDAYMNRPDVRYQELNSTPMWAEFDRRHKTFPSGKENVVVNVASGRGTIPMQGYSYDDIIQHTNPTGLNKATFPWREGAHSMFVTETELKADGVNVVDTPSGGSRTQKVTGAEKTRLIHLFEHKLHDLDQSRTQNMDLLLHGDGTADPKLPAGILALIKANPAAGTTGGISRTTSPWWRNVAYTAAAAAAGSGEDAITSNPANGGALIAGMQGIYRGLKRYASGRDSLRIFAGTDWIGAYENELRSNGTYSVSGFADKRFDGHIKALSFAGDAIIQDPTLDDVGLSKSAFIIDMNAIYIAYMKEQRKKRRTPARPDDQFIFVQTITDTFSIVAEQLNTSARVDIK